LARVDSCQLDGNFTDSNTHSKAISLIVSRKQRENRFRLLFLQRDQTAWNVTVFRGKDQLLERKVFVSEEQQRRQTQIGFVQSTRQ